MEARKIGQGGPALNPIGLGCMGLAAYYGPAKTQAEVNTLISAAIENGVRHFDTAEGYRTNEEQLGEAFAGRRDQVFIATKFGPVPDESNPGRLKIDGSEANMRRAIEQSLRRLRTDHVDLYYLHRRDKSRPIEETVGAMARLVQEGKVRALGLSEVGGETIRRAHAVHPIAAVQSEYSIFSRDIETGVLPTLQELGASLVAYSPLGRGMLTGAFSREAMSAQDFRASTLAPRFQGEAFEANLALVREIEALAQDKGAKAAQVALAWVLAKAPNINVIPGTTRLDNLLMNLGASAMQLTGPEIERLNALAAKVSGPRYDEHGMKLVDMD
jgi:aryl-alcohol dehydrogenase-like predicted oxidoreductase